MALRGPADPVELLQEPHTRGDQLRDAVLLVVVLQLLLPADVVHAADPRLLAAEGWARIPAVRSDDRRGHRTRDSAHAAVRGEGDPRHRVLRRCGWHVADERDR